MRAKPGPAVSVALCTRNGERFVRAQVESILSQDPAISELVVSDDGSTDRTLSIVEETVRGSGAAVVLRILRNNEPLGVTANFEQAIAACSGELIALSDQDDVWHAGRLAAVLPLFDHARVQLVHTDARLVGSAGEPLGGTLFGALEIASGLVAEENDGDALGVLLRRNTVTGATTVLRAGLVERARPFPDAWVHDEWLAVCAAIVGAVRCLPRTTIDYRQHGGNQIGVKRPTLGYKVSRVFEPGGARQERLGLQFAQLAARVDAFPELSEGDRDRIGQKAEFESARSRLPVNRLARLAPLRRLVRGGRYGRYASQGRLDVVRDLLRAP
ncbi:rhamnosyltransferase [Leifsonia xyli subsp. cynodontis DSM 46306]|jgi:glycosyltransferase involved in cell wall biosynthesis|uniref:Glycosyltransferase 2-like domain-containing protein n=1 Tax=Leifsonia xyli subsp. cynodontis DSM 46306 TaxID=1389489 RepID=U3P717_LEIXC|nr:glycosyltransferase family 2 protein [Leifsonia xyli]AGW40722.1 rhamnosyltransferase [Leifsonia xyli subsp. cynodontis DSM 46306]